MPQYDRLAVHVDSDDDRILHVELDNGERNNTLDYRTLTELHEAFVAADRADEVDAIIFGTTSDVFCSGADLDELTSMAFEEGTRWMSRYFETIDVLRDTGKPVVAAVEGTCAAGGNELVMGCDLVVAGESSQFGQPEVGVGSTAAGGGVQMLPLLVGEKRAREMLLIGDMYSADRMLEWGLINRVVDDRKVQTKALSLASEIIDSKSPQAYRTIKAMLKTWTNIGLTNKEMARDMTAAVWDSEEFRSRAEAFKNREPQESRSFSGVQPPKE